MKNILYLLIFAISFLVSAQDKSDELYQSIVANDYKKTEKLIEQGADVNFIKESGPWMKVSMLITAVTNGNTEIAELLLNNNVDVNWKDGFKTSAILYAANSGNTKMLNLLLEYDANINDNDSQGNTVLTAAKESNNMEMIKLVQERLKE